jgi:hypothetical protein
MGNSSSVGATSSTGQSSTSEVRLDASTPPPPDAGLDAGRDAAPVNLPDAARDAGADGGTSPGWDAAVDAGRDGGVGPDGAPGEACAAGLPWRTVAVRVHLLQSALASFDATIDEAGFRAVLAEASRRWDQACIRFEIERVVQDPLTTAQEQQFAQRRASGFTDSRALMRDAMPVGQLLDPGWNVMVFPYFDGPPASGIYMGEIQSVLWAQRLPPVAPPGDNPPIILAHEFGHSFGLLHYAAGDAALNLMNADVLQTRDTALGLNAAQIDAARAQVTTGDSAPPDLPRPRPLGAGRRGDSPASAPRMVAHEAEQARFGLPAAGFTRIRCARCGHDDSLAFSCKTRQLCPAAPAMPPTAPPTSLTTCFPWLPFASGR